MIGADPAKEGDLKIILDEKNGSSPVSEFQEKVSIDRSMKNMMSVSLKDIMGAYLFKID